MTKSQHIAFSRKWIQKIVNYRRALIYRKNKGRPDGPEMEKALKHMAYHAANIREFDKMLNLLQKPKNIEKLKLIIPANKPEWWVEHEHLVFEGNLILGKVTKQMEISF